MPSDSFGSVCIHYGFFPLFLVILIFACIEHEAAFKKSKLFKKVYPEPPHVLLYLLLRPSSYFS